MSVLKTENQEPVGYATTFRADYECMKCAHRVFSKHPVSLGKCPGCGKNSWRRYMRQGAAGVTETPVRIPAK